MKKAHALPALIVPTLTQKSLRTLLLILLLLLYAVAAAQDKTNVPVRGIYGNFGTFLTEEQPLQDLGVNALFIRGYTINPEDMQKAKNQDLQVYVEFPTLNGKNYIKDHPEAWAINSKGEQVEQAGWFMGVCPTEPGFKKHRREKLRELLREYQVEGVFMDYLHWHAQFETPEPILPETCFCANCLATFQADAGISVPKGSTAEKADWILTNTEEAWRDWRCQVIARWVSDFRTIIDQEQSGTLLGIYHCPWDDEAFDGARRNILGLDYGMLRKHVDVFSPMLYHVLMDHDPEWIGDNLRWFSNKLNINKNHRPKLWPIVQAYDNPRPIPPEEFKSAMQEAIIPQTSGIMMFSARAIEGDTAKLKVIRELYSKWGD